MTSSSLRARSVYSKIPAPALRYSLNSSMRFMLSVPHDYSRRPSADASAVQLDGGTGHFSGSVIDRDPGCCHSFVGDGSFVANNNCIHFAGDRSRKAPQWSTVCVVKFVKEVVLASLGDPPASSISRARLRSRPRSRLPTGSVVAAVVTRNARFRDKLHLCIILAHVTRPEYTPDSVDLLHIS